jgi:hypothetical protein
MWQEENSTVTGINLITPMTALSVTVLNIPIKRQRLLHWIEKCYPTVQCIQETHFKYKDTNKLKIKWWKKIILR